MSNFTQKTKDSMHKIGKALSVVGRVIGRFFYRYRSFFKRLGIAALTLSLSTILIFFVIRLTPGDVVEEYARTLMQSRRLDPEAARQLAMRLLNYNPDENIFMQFFRYIGGLFRGELGVSIYVDGVTANSLIAQRMPWTLFITSVALIISFIIGTAMGSFMARKRKGAANGLMNSYIIVSGAVPDYLMGLFLVLIFAYSMGIFPAMYGYDIEFSTPGFNFKFIIDVLYHAILPIVAYVFVQTGSWALMMRGNAVGVLGEDYIHIAKARGLKDSTITNKYLKRNAMLPLITTLTLTFGGLFGGSPLMESIFEYPGIGMELAERITSKDFFVVQGILFFSSAMIIIINLITDSIYSLVDPRVRRGE